MNKLLALVAVVFVALTFFFVAQKESSSTGIDVGDFGYSAVTEATATCAGVASSIVASNTARTSFFVSISPSATNTITICKNTACAVNASGIFLNATTGPRFVQEDGYVGPYSCISSVGSTTVGYAQSL